MATLRRAVLFAKDMKRMTAFYRDGLGLKVSSESAGWTELDAGGASLALHAIPEAIAKNIVVARPPRAREDTPMKLVFETADIDALRAHLAKHGAVMREPRGSACDGLDPEGNVFQIARSAAVGS